MHFYFDRAVHIESDFHILVQIKIQLFHNTELYSNLKYQYSTYNHDFSGDGISGGEQDQDHEDRHGKERSRKMSIDDSGPEEAKCRKHGAKKQQKTEEGKQAKGERGGKDGQQKNQHKDGQQNKERPKGINNTT